MAFTSGQVVNAADLNDLDITTLTTSGTVTIGGFTLPAVDGSADQVLVTNGSGTVTWQDAAGGAPGGSDGQIQYNNGGAFGGASALHYDDVNNRLGIGTTSPTKKLTVSGDIQVNGSSPEIFLTDTDTNADSKISASSSVGSLIIGADINNEQASTNMVFQTDGTTKMIIKDSGNVGIGDDTPSYKLDVNGTGRFTGTLTLDGDLTGTSNSNFFVGNDSNERILFQESTNRIFFMSNGSYRWYIDNNGDLLPYTNKVDNIGTSSLRVNYFYGSVINIDNEIQVSDGSANDPSFTFSSDGDTGIYRSGTNQLDLTAGGASRLRCGSNYVKVYGEAQFSYTSTSNDWSAQPVQIISTYDSGYAGRWGNTDTHTGQLRPASGIWYVRNHNDSSYWTLAAVISNQSSFRMKQNVETWGKMKPLSSAVDASFDTTATDLVRQLRPVSYRFKKQDRLPRDLPSERRQRALDRLNRIRQSKDLPQYDSEEAIHECGRDCDGTPEEPCVLYANWERGTIGFIAEEVGEIIPEATDMEMNPRSHHKGENSAIDGLAMTAVLTKALQELDARITSLEAS